MRAFNELCDRVVARLVPQVKAAAGCPSYCFWQYRDSPQQCYKQRCCQSGNCSVSCSGDWVRC